MTIQEKKSVYIELSQIEDYKVLCQRVKELEPITKDNLPELRSILWCDFGGKKDGFINSIGTLMKTTVFLFNDEMRKTILEFCILLCDEPETEQSNGEN